MSQSIPAIDLSPFFQQNSEPQRLKAKESIALACQSYGFFRITNHGMSIPLMQKAIKLSKKFFNQSYEHKMEFSSDPALKKTPLPTGYMKQPEISGNNNEFLMMFKPELGFNIYPTEPYQFRSTLDECYHELSKVALKLAEILCDCIGLPENFITNHDEERKTDLFLALRYFASSLEDENDTGLVPHQDGSCISLVFQDEIGGLEVFKDGEWIPADYQEGSIIVNIGDLLQVMTNDRFVSAMHKVVRKEKDRYSFAFFINADGREWIEPLPQFTSEVGVLPRYKGFYYDDYMQRRMKNISVARNEFFDISQFAITTNVGSQQF